MASLFNVDAEKPLLAALIRNPELRADCPELRASDFSPEVNRVVFSMLEAILASGVEFSKYVLIDRLNSLNIKLGGVMEPANYINKLELLQVSEKAAKGLAQILKAATIRREVNQIGKDIVAATENAKHKKPSELIAEVTKLFNDHVNIIEGVKEHEPKDLFGSVREFLARETTFDTRSIASPFAVFNDLYGFFDPGSLYVLVSRMKVGKSTFWLSLGQQLAEVDVNDELRILVLDTELTTEENQSRALSAISGVKEFHIRRKNYLKSKIQNEKVEEAACQLEKLTKRVSHHYAGGMRLEEMLSVARRWAFKNLTEGKKGMIVYDYFKLNSREDFKTNALFMNIGEKVDAFKNLSKELKVPCLCFAQSNRENVETKSGNKIQNSSIIGGSDMIAQFAANIYLLERLSPEERETLNQLGDKGATHALRAIETRQLGPNELGEDRLVRGRDEKGKKEKWMENYLLFRFDSFRVSEVTTFKRLVESGQALGSKIQPPRDDDMPLL